MKHRRDLKIWGLALIAVFAFSAVAVANASAATFTTSGTGEIKGSQTGQQVLTTGAGNVTCTQAAASGPVTPLESNDLELTVKYSGCTAFGFASATVSSVTLLLHANGAVDILNTVTIGVSAAGCSVSIAPQNGLKSVTYGNTSGKLDVWFSVEGIKSKGSGGLCGGESTTGSLMGHLLIEKVGGTIEWDP